MSISTEPDVERVRERLAREEKKHAADAERARLRQQRLDLEAALASARTLNRLQCVGGSQCDRSFAQAQAYLLKQADMRIQVATPTLIETYNGTSEGQISMRLLRVPAAGDKWDIVLSAWCRRAETELSIRCMQKLIEAYAGFLPHMQQQ